MKAFKKISDYFGVTCSLFQGESVAHFATCSVNTYSDNLIYTTDPTP